MGTYQGLTEVVLSRTPAPSEWALVPRGSSKPGWLAASRNGAAEVVIDEHG